MAKFNLDYYDGEDLYSDGEIEQNILNIVQKGEKIEDLDRVEFPVFYHLSKERENVLNWYPFKKSASVLEVGAGCGAITGMLCEKVDSVVAVELSKRRALINYERHQQYDNLELVIGNFNNIKFKKTFDYIVLNGVFEYAASFTEGSTPYETFLKSLCEKLKRDGRILIAIENRLGIKYFSGAAEDHTDSFFLGMNNYEREKNVRTFSKQEWIELCKKTGMVCNKFYYPYPDYKFPNEIYTEHTINTLNYGKDYYNFNNKRFLLYNECAVLESLRKEKVASNFANSFLIEVCHYEQKDAREIEYVKINSDRRAEFRIGTRIESEEETRYVYKYSLHESAKKHIENMHIHEQIVFHEKVRLLNGIKLKEEIKYPFLKYESLSKKVERALVNEDKNEILKLLDTFFSIVFLNTQMVDYRTREFENTFGSVSLPVMLECVRPANIDLTCDNIFCVDNGAYQVIDGEWIFDFWIPKAFIIWRNLNELYEKYKNLQQLLPRNELLFHYEINGAMEKEFSFWNRCFTLEYVKANQMERYSVEKKQISLDELLNRMESQKKMATSLYLDYGQGYQEDFKIYNELFIKEDGGFEGIYEINNCEKLKKLRWDPIENRFCLCKVYAVVGEGKIRLKALNADCISEGYEVFLNGDPQYEIPDKICGSGILILKGMFHYLDEKNVLGYLGKQRDRQIKKDRYILEMENRSRKMQGEIDELNSRFKELGEELVKSRQDKEKAETIVALMENSRGWRFLEKFRKVKHTIWRQHE